jgi:hypothetical protein
MQKENIPLSDNYIDIRYKKLLSALKIIVGISISIMLMIDKKNDGSGYEFIIEDKTDLYKLIFLLPFLLYVVDGIYSLSGGRYARLDKQAKTVFVYSFFNLPFSKYRAGQHTSYTQ